MHGVRVLPAASMLALATVLAAAPARAGTPPAAADTPSSADGRGIRVAAAAAAADFDPAFFRHGNDGPSIDVTRYRQGNPVAAGRYAVDLSLNGTFLTRADIAFGASETDEMAQPCLDEAMLDKIGVDLAKLAPDVLDRLRAATGTCLPLNRILPDAGTSFSLNDQTLALTIPQAQLRNNPRGYVDPRFWDKGMTAAKLGYNLNFFNTTGQAKTTQGYLGLNAGFNIGSWRFRHDGSLSFGSGQSTRYQSNRTYVQRDIDALQSQLTLGQTFTDGQMFDSIGIRGANLATDDLMLPQSMRGYAPVVRGTARTTANVTIKQNGNLIYQEAVPPGAFEIKDLNATGYGGDLVVTVAEADGQSETFTVPFASVPNLLRKGTFRFNLSAGQIDNQLSHSQHPFLFQATGQRGMSNALTVYGGIMIAGDYKSAVVGGAFNTELGAFGLDVTVADAGIHGIDSRGASIRLSYARLIEATNTNITLGAYRYSSKGFWSLQNALSVRDYAGNDAGSVDIGRPRSNLQVNISQPLGHRWGSFYLTGSTQQYWNRKGSTTYYQAGYSNNFKGIGYSLSASRQTDSVTGEPDTRFMLTLSFQAWRGLHAPSVSSSMTAGGNQPFQAQTNISGSLGDQGNLNYGASYSHSGDTDSGSGNLSYLSPIADLNASVGIGGGYTQQSFGASGTVLIHSGGITLGRTASDPIALISAPGAGGARVASTPGVRLDGRGYAIVPYLTPYERNVIEIDPKGIDLDVELTETSQTVVPREGAFVRVKYASTTGRAAIFSVRMANGGVVPFGADVLSATGETIGQAGQGGSIFARGLADSGTLIVRWGEDPDDQCHLDYRLPPHVKGAGATAYDHAEATCTPGAPDKAPPDKATPPVPPTTGSIR
jgi:outer membrane usher protein